MKIYAIHNGVASRYYRLVPQLKYMQQQGHQAILMPHNDKYMKQHIETCDVVIFEMVLDLNMVKYAKLLGKKVIFECDDLIHIVPPTHYEYKNTKGIKNRIKWWLQLIPVLRRCDGFIATNQKLVDKYGKFCKNSLVFNNYLDLAHWLKPYKENTIDRIRLLWAGSTSHTGDLKMIKPVLYEILHKYPQVDFLYVGTGGIRTDDLNAKFIYGEDLFGGKLPEAIDRTANFTSSEEAADWLGLPDNREAMLPMTGNLWPYTLASMMADIAIAPLEENYFNSFKSTCKGLEYSINKIPAVYSGWFYKDLIINGKTGFLANTKDDWITALSRLIEDVKLRKNIGEEAYQFALKNYDIRNHIKNWQEFIENIYGVKSSSSKESDKI